MTDFTVTLKSIGPNTIAVEIDGKEVIREHFESGASAIDHSYCYTYIPLEPQPITMDQAYRWITNPSGKYVTL